MTTLLAEAEFTRLATEEQISKTVQALERNGIQTNVVETGEEARALVLSRLPPGVEIYNPPSRTLDQIGLTEDLETSKSFRSVRSRLSTLDREKHQREMHQIIASPEIVIGSVHAITENGEVLIASATGSQLSSAAFGADNVIWVVGTQKLVSTLDEGLRRIREYSFPLENQRTQQVYGRPSAINKVLLVNAEIPGRITVILVKQDLGF